MVWYYQWYHGTYTSTTLWYGIKNYVQIHYIKNDLYACMYGHTIPVLEYHGTMVSFGMVRTMVVLASEYHGTRVQI